MPVRKPLNIAIAGCGPAGLAAALLLHRDGHKVTIYERFENPQSLGSGLMIQPTGLAVLAQLGLADRLIRLGARIDRLFGKNAISGRMVLDVSYAPLGADISGLGVHRAALFDLLFNATMADNIIIKTGQTITGSELVSGRQRLLKTQSGETQGPFDLIIDALGSRSSLANSPSGVLPFGAIWANLPWLENAGFDPHALEQRYIKASTMAGVLPVGQQEPDGQKQAAFFWSLRVRDFESWQAAGIDAWKADVTKLWPETDSLLTQIISLDALTFARYSHRTHKPAFSTGLIHIGDSWHSTSPQLGQGANMALMDAYALALALRQEGNLDTALKRAIGFRANHVWLYQTMSALFTPFYQSDSAILPLIRDRLVGPLSRMKPFDYVLSAMVSGLVGRPLKPLGIEKRIPARPAALELEAPRSNPGLDLGVQTETNTVHKSLVTLKRPATLAK